MSSTTGGPGDGSGRLIPFPPGSDVTDRPVPLADLDRLIPPTQTAPPESDIERTIEIPAIREPIAPESALSTLRSEPVSSDPGEQDEYEDVSESEYMPRRTLLERVSDWLEYRIERGRAGLEGDAAYREAVIAAKVARLKADTERDIALLEAHNKLRQAGIQAAADKKSAQAKGDAAATKAAGGSSPGGGPGRGGGRGGSGSGPAGGAKNASGAGGGRGGAGAGTDKGGRTKERPRAAEDKRRAKEPTRADGRGSTRSTKGNSGNGQGGRAGGTSPRQERTDARQSARADRQADRGRARQQRRAADQSASLADRTKDRDQARGERQRARDKKWADRLEREAEEKQAKTERDTKRAQRRAERRTRREQKRQAKQGRADQAKPDADQKPKAEKTGKPDTGSTDADKKDVDKESPGKDGEPKARKDNDKEGKPKAEEDNGKDSEPKAGKDDGKAAEADSDQDADKTGQGEPPADSLGDAARDTADADAGSPKPEAGATDPESPSERLQSPTGGDEPEAAETVDEEATEGRERHSGESAKPSDKRGFGDRLRDAFRTQDTEPEEPPPPLWVPAEGERARPPLRHQEADDEIVDAVIVDDTPAPAADPPVSDPPQDVAGTPLPEKEPWLTPPLEDEELSDGQEDDRGAPAEESVPDATRGVADSRTDDEPGADDRSAPPVPGSSLDAEPLCGYPPEEGQPFTAEDVTAGVDELPADDRHVIGADDRSAPPVPGSSLDAEPLCGYPPEEGEQFTAEDVTAAVDELPDGDRHATGLDVPTPDGAPLAADGLPAPGPALDTEPSDSQNDGHIAVADEVAQPPGTAVVDGPPVQAGAPDHDEEAAVAAVTDATAVGAEDGGEERPSGEVDQAAAPGALPREGPAVIGADQQPQTAAVASIPAQAAAPDTTVPDTQGPAPGTSDTDTDTSEESSTMGNTPARVSAQPLAAQHQTEITFGQYLVQMTNIALTALEDRETAQDLVDRLLVTAKALQEMADDLAGDHNVDVRVTVQITDLSEALAQMIVQADRSRQECGDAAEAALHAARGVARVYGRDMDAKQDAGLAHTSAAAHHN